MVTWLCKKSQSNQSDKCRHPASRAAEANAAVAGPTSNRQVLSDERIKCSGDSLAESELTVPRVLAAAQVLTTLMLRSSCQGQIADGLGVSNMQSAKFKAWSTPA
jgi:hypothetical protein